MERGVRVARSIMIQGTMSNAGKSLIAAGLCRIFAQDGYRVAPFKSQNMALNSFITRDNLEMGRAQAVQAEACGIEPDIAMNPILLKPTTDMGSQVIVNGEVAGEMKAIDYYRKKRDYIPIIREAYTKLAAQYDIIVIEGAGSPAEINLRKDDIVNMGMAEFVDAPVLLVGDIDRGGVFAQLIGTMELLEESERDRIKGFLINKFRGDVKILMPGLDMLTERCGKKVLGVVPYMTDIGIEDEDSLAERLGISTGAGNIDVAVIKLPRLSNFTDFQAFDMEECVSVRYVDRLTDLGRPDVVVMPGTKSTMHDMRWLRESGLEAAIMRMAQSGTVIFGICGGYQMLGEIITDACGAEACGSIRGMGLLPIRTVFEREKTRSRVCGKIAEVQGPLEKLSGKKVSGYEIHMGKSEYISCEGDLSGSDAREAAYGHALCISDKKDGFYRENVFGTYLHGIFDEEDFRHAFVEMLCDRKGIAYLKEDKVSESYSEYREKQFDRLAGVLRESMDIDAIYRIMGEGAGKR